ncbi:MAG: 23S rRNA (uracil(1939)-C(5))-methyltransferase RlmD [Bacillota bacterium]
MKNNSKLDIQENDILELTIDDIGSNGEGIAHYGEMTVFVPYAITGEKVSAKVIHIRRNMIYTVLKKVIEPSVDRVEAGCPLFGTCGGCSLMHLSYEAQLAVKAKNLATILKKNSGLTTSISDVVASCNLHYRNKIQLPFGTEHGAVVMGFYREKTHRIIPLSNCPLHADWADKLIEITKGFANAARLSSYNEQTGKGLLRHLVARYIGGGLTVTLVINGRQVPKIQQYVALLTEAFSNVSVYLSVNTIRNNVIMGKELIAVKPTAQTVNIMGIDVDVNPMSFFQINDYIRDKIYSDVVEMVAPTSDSIVIDAYSGVGLLGAIMAKMGAQIYNIEIIPEAIIDANNLYKNNDIERQAVNICGDSVLELGALITRLDLNSSASEKCVTIILDPPRKGVAEEVLKAINALTIKYKLIYISCNPATLSRDLTHLLDTHSITSITPYDMFPNTPHLETVALLERI